MVFLQCSDTVGWVTGRASGLWKVGCWFVGGDILTGALYVMDPANDVVLETRVLVSRRLEDKNESLGLGS